ncbi:MAG: peptidylprolyl isomerase [Anaerolineae bacterium]
MRYRLGLLVAILLIAVPTFAQDEAVAFTGTPADICDTTTPAEEPQTREFEQPDMILEDDVDYRAVLCTSAGPIYVDLYEDFAPLTVNNFVFLAEQDYFNNTIFHRVIEDFMAQAGDPTGTGTGGPGYQFADEIVGFLNFDRPGLLAMANAGPGTNGSQFFITTAETPWLNGAHTIYGEVLEGQSGTVDNILLRDPESGGDATTLDSVVIIREPDNVETTFEETATTATVEEVVAGLDQLSNEGVLPPDIAFSGAETLTTDEVVERAPENLTDDYAAFLDTYGHDYRVSGTLNNADCNPDYFFNAMSYSVDAFASSADASDALADGFLTEYYTTTDYTVIETPDFVNYQAYRSSLELCNAEGIVIAVELQRGRYIANVSVVFAADMLDNFNEAQLATVAASNVAQLLEFGLADVYRAELR